MFIYSSIIYEITSKHFEGGSNAIETTRVHLTTMLWCVRMQVITTLYSCVIYSTMYQLITLSKTWCKQLVGLSNCCDSSAESKVNCLLAIDHASFVDIYFYDYQVSTNQTDYALVS